MTGNPVPAEYQYGQQLYAWVHQPGQDPQARFAQLDPQQRYQLYLYTTWLNQTPPPARGPGYQDASGAWVSTASGVSPPPIPAPGQGPPVVVDPPPVPGPVPTPGLSPRTRLWIGLGIGGGVAALVLAVALWRNHSACQQFVLAVLERQDRMREIRAELHSEGLGPEQRQELEQELADTEQELRDVGMKE
jgi:hypothetical protein